MSHRVNDHHSLGVGRRAVMTTFGGVNAGAIAAFTGNVRVVVPYVTV